MSHIFLSYSHADKDLAGSLKAELEAVGFEVWKDTEEIEAGEEWRRKIDEAIMQSVALIILITPAGNRSKYITYEWAYARGAGVQDIPIMLKPTKMHPPWDNFHYLDFVNNKSQLWDRLVEQLKRLFEQSIASKIPVPPDIPANIRGLVGKLDSLYADERLKAVDALGDSYTSQAFEVLANAIIYSNREDVRQAAAAKLSQEIGKVNSGSLKDAVIVPALIASLKEHNHQIKKIVVETLITLNDMATVHTLIEALKDKDHFVRRSVIEVLEKIRNTATVQALIEALKDEDDFVRRKAANTLGILQDKTAVPALIEVLERKDEDAWTSAAEALGALRARAAVPTLTQALEDPNPDIHEAAARALQAITGD